MTAFVLGNGTSRETVNIETLMSLGSVYGCNGIYRTHTVTALVATDRPISQKIQQSGYSLKHRFYTRRPLPDSGAMTVPKEYFGYSSGPNAVGIAAKDKHHRIYLLGFDMAPTVTGNFNNIYAGTEFYKDIGASPTYTGNWAKQLRKVIEDFSKQQFVRVHGETTADLADLENLKNLEKLSLEAFLYRINNRKDI